MALYFSTNGFSALITAFNATHHQIETRTWFKQRLISFYLVIISTVLMTLAIGLIIGTEIIMHKLFHRGQLQFHLIQFGRWLIVFSLFYSLISFTFYLAPSRKSGWKFASAGSMLATILSIITSIGFAYYVNHFGKYNKLYGSIGTLIVILMWIYFNMLVILVGFDLNVSILEAKRNKEELESAIPE
jgi:membrane protein